jgi:hypothetical protein
VLNFYTDDNKGYFMSGSGGSHFEWMEPARPYYKEDEMRFCPMAKKNEHPGTGHWGSTFTTWERDEFVGSYGINEFLFNPNMDTQWGHATSMNWRSRRLPVGRCSSAPYRRTSRVGGRMAPFLRAQHETVLPQPPQRGHQYYLPGLVYPKGKIEIFVEAQVEPRI